MGRAYRPACVGLCCGFPFRFFLRIIWCSFLSPVWIFLQYLTVAVELELLGGGSSLFPSFLFIATHHLGVTLERRGGVRAGGLLQRCGKSWCSALAEMNVAAACNALPLREPRSRGSPLGSEGL